MIFLLPDFCLTYKFHQFFFPQNAHYYLKKMHTHSHRQESEAGGCKFETRHSETLIFFLKKS